MYNKLQESKHNVDRLLYIILSSHCGDEFINAFPFLFAGVKRTRMKSATAVNVNKVCFDSDETQRLSQVKSEFAFPFQMNMRVISHSKLQEQPLLADFTPLDFFFFFFSPSSADMDMSLRNMHKHLEQPRASPARPHADS